MQKFSLFVRDALLTFRPLAALRLANPARETGLSLSASVTGRGEH
jgi:hypothetical protein